MAPRNNYTTRIKMTTEDHAKGIFESLDDLRFRVEDARKSGLSVQISTSSDTDLPNRISISQQYFYVFTKDERKKSG